MPATVALLFALTGCITIQLNNPTTGRDADGRLAETVDCAAQKTVTLNVADTDYTLTGSCREVTVEGTRLAVAAEDVTQLTVRGDANVIAVHAFGTLTVEGQGNQIEAGDGGDVAVNGNENSVHSADDLHAVTVNGQGNDVTAEGFIVSFEENGSSR